MRVIFPVHFTLFDLAESENYVVFSILLFRLQKWIFIKFGADSGF
jgi:hypothetical protein